MKEEKSNKNLNYSQMVVDKVAKGHFTFGGAIKAQADAKERAE